MSITLFYSQKCKALKYFSWKKTIFLLLKWLVNSHVLFLWQIYEQIIDYYISKVFFR